MKKLLYIIISVSLLAASCTEEPDEAMFQDLYASTGPYPYSDGALGGKDMPMDGTYSLAWVIDKEVVDTATFSTEVEPYFAVITHFPMQYFLNMVGVKVAQEDIYYDMMSYWRMSLNTQGLSQSNVYLSNTTWAPRIWFSVKGEDYEFLIYMNKEENMPNWYTSLMYDTVNDVWSGATPVYKFRLTNHKTYEWWEKTFTTPINMTFQTTGRKK